MHWIWPIAIVLLTLVLIFMIPQHVVRTAIGNCTRADGTKSGRRKRREIKHLLEFILSVLSIPALIVGIHIGIFMLMDKFYVGSIPTEWVDEIERADTDEGEVGEALTKFTDWQEQQRKIFHSAATPWHDVLRKNWLFLAADIVLMGILLYWVIGPLFIGLVSNYREGIERRHRHYVWIDQERAEESNTEHEFSVGATASSSEKVQRLVNVPTSNTHQEVESPYASMHDFIMEISQAGFLEDLFRGLELPTKPMTKSLKEHGETQFNSVSAESIKGFTADTNIDLRGALRHQIARRTSYMERLREKENELNTLLLSQQDSEENSGVNDAPKLLALKNQIKELNQEISKIPSTDTDDSMAHNRLEQPYPSNQAVLFCLMDASGSMGRDSKEIAKRFYILLYLFLKQSYDHVKVVYIRHHTSAQEFDEDGFFRSRETGGTVISSGLQLMHEIIQERFRGPSFEIYAVQVSDGDNWDGDSPYCCNLLKDKILPSLHYFTYVETTQVEEQTLWQAYQAIEADYDNFTMQQIDHPTAVYPLFRDIFNKQLA